MEHGESVLVVQDQESPAAHLGDEQSAVVQGRQPAGRRQPLQCAIGGLRLRWSTAARRHRGDGCGQRGQPGRAGQNGGEGWGPRAMQFHTPHATNRPRPTSIGRGRSGIDSYAALGTDGCLNLGGRVRGDPVLPRRVVLQELVRGGGKVPVQLAEVALRLQLVGRVEVPLPEECD